MWSSAGRERVAAAVVMATLAGCADPPDIHLEIARLTNQKVTLQLCDPASAAIPCKTHELFEAADAIATTRTVDVFVDDATPALILQFTLAAPNFCTQVGVIVRDPIAAHLTLPADAAGLAEIEGCGDRCTPEACR